MVARSHSRRKARSDLPPARILGRYLGQWVAFYRRRVVASGDNFGKVLDEGRAALRGEEPTLMRVPSGDLYVL